jgi:hypothetical protein
MITRNAIIYANRAAFEIWFVSQASTCDFKGFVNQFILKSANCHFKGISYEWPSYADISAYFDDACYIEPISNIPFEIKEDVIEFTWGFLKEFDKSKDLSDCIVFYRQYYFDDPKNENKEAYQMFMETFIHYDLNGNVLLCGIQQSPYNELKSLRALSSTAEAILNEWTAEPSIVVGYDNGDGLPHIGEHCYRHWECFEGCLARQSERGVVNGKHL